MNCVLVIVMLYTPPDISDPTLIPLEGPIKEFLIKILKLGLLNNLPASSFPLLTEIESSPQLEVKFVITT